MFNAVQLKHSTDTVKLLAHDCDSYSAIIQQPSWATAARLQAVRTLGTWKGGGYVPLDLILLDLLFNLAASKAITDGAHWA